MTLIQLCTLSSIKTDFCILQLFILFILSAHCAQSPLCSVILYLPCRGGWRGGVLERASSWLGPCSVPFPAESSGGWNANYVPSACFLTLCSTQLLQAAVCRQSRSLYSPGSWNMLHPSGRHDSAARSAACSEFAFLYFSFALISESS